MMLRRSHISIYKLTNNKLFRHSSTRVSSLSREERYNPSPSNFNIPTSFNKKRDVIIIGGGHNGLTAASYLSKSGCDVLILERRDKIGGAAITEEIFPGFKFSRASYLAGLLRPVVLKELKLKEKYNLEFIIRNPSSFTPTTLNDPLYGGKYLMFWNGNDSNKTYESISQFSVNDAHRIDEYENYLENIRLLLQPFLDNQCPDLNELDFSSLLKIATSFTMSKNIKTSPFMEIFKNIKSSQTIYDFIELMTSPANKILNKYFESDIVKTTLAIDAVVGSVLSPNDTGSAYVLLHHIMGESEGLKGVWSYAKGGMGSISNSLRDCCIDNGSEVVCNAEVSQIIWDDIQNKAIGVQMNDGTIIESDIVLSNGTPYHTFKELFPDNNNPFSNTFMNDIVATDYSCGAFKINLVVNELPNFECMPNEFDSNGIAIVGPQHKGTIHFESRMEALELASFQSKQGIPADRPIIEMTIPSSLDPSVITNEKLFKKGYHIIQLFIQHAPYDLNYNKLGVSSWDDNNGDFKQIFIEKVFKIIDEFAPNFSSSIQNYDALSPRDLEKIFGLYKGNIFHGSISLDQIGWQRPIKDIGGNYNTPLDGLYLCGAGCHPGGGVMGAAGRNCANVILNELKRKKKKKKK